MMKPNITTYYLVHDLRDDASWGAYETIKAAKDDIRKQLKYHNRTIDEFEVVREVIVADVVWSGSDET